MEPKSRKSVKYVQRQIALQWKQVDFLQECQMQTRYRTILVDEFRSCLMDKTYEPSQIFNLSDKIRAPSTDDFNESNNIELFQNIDDNEKKLKWVSKTGRQSSVKSGSDIKVEDLIRSIRKGCSDYEKLTFTSHYLSWTSVNGITFNPSIFQCIEGIVSEDSNVIKLGSIFYRISNEEGSYFWLTKNFMDVLKHHLIKEKELPVQKVSGNKVFPLPWNISGKRSAFTLEEIAYACATNEDNIQLIKEALNEILISMYKIIDNDTVMLFSKESSILPQNPDLDAATRRAQMLNCCLLKKTFEFSKSLKDESKDGGLLRILSDLLLDNAKIPQDLKQALEHFQESKTDDFKPCVLASKTEDNFLCQNPIFCTNEITEDVDQSRLQSFLWDKLGKSFTIQELMKNCVTNPNAIDTEVKKNLTRVLTQKIRLMDKKQTFYKIDADLLSKSKIGKQFTIDSLKLILKFPEKINFDNSLNELREETSLCAKLSDGKFKVKKPYLTTSFAHKLWDKSKNSICLSKLIQFLRGHALCDEGHYNELYHLGNCCPSHTQGYIFLVGDRVLDQNNIELYDVLAIAPSNNVFFLHVKKNADANSTRNCSSQVKVCAEELKKSFIYDVDNDAFDQIYQASQKVDEKSPIHRRLLKANMDIHFSNQEEFIRKMRNSTMHVCLSLADQNVSQTWERMSKIDISKDVSKIITEPFELKRLVEMGYIGKKNFKVSETFLKTNKTDFEKKMHINLSISKKRAGEMYEWMKRDLTQDIRQVTQNRVELDRLTEKKMIVGNKITEDFRKKKKGEFQECIKLDLSLTEKRAREMYAAILQDLHEDDKGRLSEEKLRTFLKENLISKFEINTLQNHFNEKMMNKIRFRILPVPTM